MRPFACGVAFFAAVFAGLLDLRAGDFDFLMAAAVATLAFLEAVESSR